MGVLTTKFYSSTINTSKFIPFLRSIITFSGKRQLKPEGVTGGFSHIKGLFRGSYLMSIAAIKSLCHRSSLRLNCLFRSRAMFFSVLIASNSTARFGSIYNTRCILPLPIITPSFSSLHSLEAEKRLPEIRAGFVCLGHKTGSGVPRSLGFST